RYYRNFAVRNGVSPERAVATRVLADDAYARVQRRSEATQQAQLVYVGRLDADKFALDLVECLALVGQRFPGVELVCAGSGALDGEMRRRARELGVNGRLRLLGAVDLAELPNLIASSHVVVAPHMGYTLIEAGLTGTPIVTYDFDFHSEIIEDGLSGYLVPLRDVDTLAERVVTLLQNPERARAMGACLRGRLLREHSREAVVPLYREAYAMALQDAA
ncbi:MAG TPA: glycosyltransferase, partial [Chloroflexota bacterium]|nr:glycosyltransferase [Chloroflexota bacterium]